jgi:simple sugar transport system permease protein
MLPNLLTGTRLHWGIVAAPLAAAALAWWMRTPRGLAYEVLGANPALAARVGVRHGRATVSSSPAMTVSSTPERPWRSSTAW